MCKINMQTDLVLLGSDDWDWADIENGISEYLPNSEINEDLFKDEFSENDSELEDWEEIDDTDDDYNSSWSEMSYNRYNKDRIVYGE